MNKGRRVRKGKRLIAAALAEVEGVQRCGHFDRHS
jgi:hypothetical protein